MCMFMCVGVCVNEMSRADVAIRRKPVVIRLSVAVKVKGRPCFCLSGPPEVG